MEIPYEIKLILNNDESDNNISNDYITLDPSLIQYFTEEEKFSIMSLIDELGQLSNKERHISYPITSFNSFINSNNVTKTKNKIILKCINNLIIGFIHFKYGPILLRNEFNLNYFYKNIITISDFYVMRNYRRMNYGKDLFDKVIYMTNTKPVLMAFEFPNKALINFLEKFYGISNPISQGNNLITFYNYYEDKFNKYLDDYHRIIDVNKMEDDIDNYRKWSPYDIDFNKRFNSGISDKNFFPLKFNNKRSKIYKINNNRYNNIENNYIRNYNDKNYNYNHDNINSKRSEIIGNYNRNNYFNRSNNNIGINNIKKQFHLNDKKMIFGKKNNGLRRSAPIPFAIKEMKDITSNNYKENDKNYFHKFNDVYLNDNKNNNNSNININQHNSGRNLKKENYYNYIDHESIYYHNMLNKQKENEKRLNRSVIRLTNRIKDNINKTPIRNKNEINMYYRKNRSFATVFDTVESIKTEENDFKEYKKFKDRNEYFN